MNKELINQKRRENYALNKDEKNKKRRSNAEFDPIKKLKKQVASTIYNSYIRKGFQRMKPVDEILGRSLDEEVERLLKYYKHKYKKEYDGTEQVHVDHIIPLWMAKTVDDVDKCNRCLQLLTAKDNNRKSGKLSNGIGRNGRIKYVSYYDTDMFE